MDSPLASEINTLLSRHHCVPVVTGCSPEQAVPLAEALLAGGVQVMELPVRGDQNAVLQAITQIRRSVPKMTVGAGTLTSIDLLMRAIDAGAQFGVSPGVPDTQLHEAIRNNQFHFIPGVLAKNSLGGNEIAQKASAKALIEMGYRVIKWFHAGQSGGIEGLRSFIKTFPEILWMPMGSIGSNEMWQYTALDQVIACGGAWPTPKELLDSSNWRHISLLAQQAVKHQ